MTYEDNQRISQRINTAIDAVGGLWTGRKQATFGLFFTPKSPRGLLNVMNRKLMKEPCLQGNLDSMCGIYSVLNSLYLLDGKIDMKEAFDEIVYFLNAKECLVGSLVSGLHRNNILEILKHVSEYIQKIYIKRLIWKTPYWNKRSVELGVFYNTLNSHINEKTNNSAIICLGGKVWDHWTVVNKITRKQLWCFDSFKLQRLILENCATCTKEMKKSHLIFPSHTFLISAE